MIRKMNHRRLLAVWLSVTSLAWSVSAVPAQEAGQATAGGKIYVADQASNQITVIDGTTFDVIKTVAVGDRPHNVNHTPDGRLVLVTNKNVNIDQAPSLSIIYQYRYGYSGGHHRRHWTTD